MAMEHKPFVFEYDLFAAELEPMLREALTSGDSGALQKFVDKNLAHLKDPNDGQPLDKNWRLRLESLDPHQVGDIALTKYYDPEADLGLGSKWMKIDDATLRIPDAHRMLLGHRIVGGNGVAFDPGKMGAFVQRRSELEEHIGRLGRIVAESPELKAHVAEIIAVLRLAADAGAGLYTTF